MLRDYQTNIKEKKISAIQYARELVSEETIELTCSPQSFRMCADTRCALPSLPATGLHQGCQGFTFCAAHSED